MASAAVELGPESSTPSLVKPEWEDIELTLLEMKLDLLTSQRTLAAVRCQRFTDFLDESMLKSHSQWSTSLKHPSTSAEHAQPINEASPHESERADVWGDTAGAHSSRHVSRRPQARRGSLDSLSQQQPSHLGSRTALELPSGSTRRASFEVRLLHSPSTSAAYGLTSETKPGSGIPRRPHRRSLADAPRRFEANSEMSREAAQYYSSSKASNRRAKECSHSPTQQHAAVEPSEPKLPALLHYRGLGNTAAHAHAADGPTSAGHSLTFEYEHSITPPQGAPDSGTEDRDTSEASDAESFLHGTPPARAHAESDAWKQAFVCAQEPKKKSGGFRRFFRR